MPRLDENSAATLILKFSNGNGFSLSFEDSNLEDPTDNTQSVEVSGTVGNQEMSASYFNSYFDADAYYDYDGYDEWDEDEDADWDEKESEADECDDEDWDDDELWFLGDQPVACGFSTTIISQLVNAGSVAELVRRVSDMYHIFHEDEADFLSGVCPDCEINDARAFEPYDVTMDLAGTTQEGRPDRIEQLKIGDEVRFVREPDNPYDTNAIDVRSEQGSLGHVHGEIAKFLSPLMDQGILKITAKVASMTTRKQRSARAKKPLLDISCVYTLQKDGEEKQFTKLTDLHKELPSQEFKLEDHFKGQTLEAVKDILSELKDATRSEHAISDCIEQSIRENMKTMDDLEEVILTTGSFTSYYREPGMCSPDSIIYHTLGGDASFEINRIINEAADSKAQNIIDGLKSHDIFKNVSEESLFKIAYLYEEDALEDVNDYAVKQTWRKGGEININFAFFENPFFGIFDISDVDDLDDEDWAPDFTDDTMVEVKHGIPFVRWAEDDEEEYEEEE